MSLQVEKLEKNMAKLTIEATAEEFEKAMEKAYQKNKGKIVIQGFRKGKAPQAMIEKMYGSGIFYEDAANFIVPSAYEKSVEESELKIVSQPEIDIVQVEKGKNFIFTALVALKPKVTLGDYKGIEVDKIELAVTEEEIDQELEKVREQNSRMISIEDRAVQNKDIVIMDFQGFVDGVPFEGGKGEDETVTIGSHTFIDTFEEQLIGKNIGEEVEVHVTFPEGYQAEELSGKPALFQVVIHEIKKKELPMADDEFAQDISDFETIAEYKEDISKEIMKRKEEAGKSAKEDAVLAIIIEKASMEIPDSMLNTQIKQMTDDFIQRIQSQGLTVEQYFKFTGMNLNKFSEQMRPQALKRIQSRLVLEEIVKNENIVSSEEEIEKEIEKMASMYKMDIEKLKEFMVEKEREELMMDLAVQKAVDFVIEAAVER